MFDRVAFFGFLAFSALILSLSLIPIGNTDDYKYKISAPGFGCYYVSKYTIDGKCVKFKYNDKNHTFCGTYEIVEKHYH